MKEVGRTRVHGVTLSILKEGRFFAVNREFRTVSKVPGSLQLLTVVILEKRCFYSNVGIVMFFGLKQVLSEGE